MSTNLEKRAKIQKALIIISHLIGRLGSSIFGMGIGLMILRETGSASNFGFTQVIGPVMMLLLLPFTGSIIDKINHKKIVVVAQSSSILAIILFLWANNIQILPKLILIYILLTVLAVTDLFLETTYSSSLISMVEKEEVQKMMSIKQMIGTAVMIVAPISAGILYNFLSFEQFVLMEISSEIITLLLVLGINFYMYHSSQATVMEGAAGADAGSVKDTQDSKDTDSKPEGFRGMLAMFGEGISYVKQSKGLSFLIVFSMFINIVITSYMVGYPYVMIEHFGFSNVQFGVSQVAFSVGMLMAGIVLSKKKDFVNPLYNAWKLVFAVLLNLALVGVLVFLNGSQWFSFIGTMVINLTLGVLLGMVNIPMQVMMTKTVPQKMQGRVFNLMSTSSQVLMPLGTLFFGFIFDSGLRADIIFIMAALAGVVISMVIPMLLKVRFHELGMEN